MNKDDKLKLLKRTVLASAMGALLLAAPLATNAAGMGKITVLSALGQPLRAELDITASREELGSLAARVAPVEAFRQANVEYAGVLSTVRFVLDKHPDGKPYFKIQTDRAVNEPFIDFLVELSWSSGRLVREYAFLLDPPDSNIANVGSGSGSSASISAAQAQPTPEMVSAPSTVVAADPVEMQAKPQMKPPPVSASSRSDKDKSIASGDSGNTRTVKAGDTLGKIAAESAVEGVSLDQMLVALFNSNRDAFIGNNMNRLRAGKILTIPDADKIAAISTREARKVVVAQSAEFNAYRSSLASSVAKQTPMEQPSQQSSGGKIAPIIEEKSAQIAGQDKLQVSRGDAVGKSGKGKASEEDIVARDKALKEANSRIADLEKNLTDLKKLAELKSQAATDAQKPPAAGLSVPTVAALPAVPAVGVAATPMALSPVAAAPADTAALSGTAAISGTAAATPVAEEPKPMPKKKFVPPPSPPPEPSFIEDNPLVVYGGGAGIAALLGFFGFRSWKKKRDARGKGITVSDIAASSVFGAASSQNVDTGAASKTDFGHSTIEEIDTSKESVDPIQEAEVYMAYGRDGQAEEILIDAMQKDPGNQAVLLKLLEIYSGRKSVPQFNTVATDLQQRTGGAGTIWEKAAAMGLVLDPANPLYGGSQSGGGSTEQTVVMEAAGDTSMESTMVMASPPAQQSSPGPVAEEAPSAMDFDLDIGGDSTPATVEPAASADSTAMDMDFDLDLGGGSADASSDASLDLNVDTPSAGDAGGNVIDFDIALPSSEPHSSASLDLSAINLDLGEPTGTGAASGDNPEVATKLELAQAYEEMGDAEGARELLNEVIAEGSPAQQEVARGKLAKLG